MLTVGCSANTTGVGALLVERSPFKLLQKAQLAEALSQLILIFSGHNIHLLASGSPGDRVRGVIRKILKLVQSDSPRTDSAKPQKLSEADQAQVDAFLERGVNSVERKPFRPLFLIFLLMAVVAGFSLLSQGIAQWAGIY